MTKDPLDTVELEKRIKQIVNCVGSPYGEGATYDGQRPKRVIEEAYLPEAEENLSHLDKKDWQNMVDDIKALIQEAVRLGRIDEVNHIPYWGTPYDTDVFGYETLFRDNRIKQLEECPIPNNQDSQEGK